MLCELNAPVALLSVCKVVAVILETMAIFVFGDVERVLSNIQDLANCLGIVGNPSAIWSPVVRCSRSSAGPGSPKLLLALHYLCRLKLLPQSATNCGRRNIL